MQKLSGVSVRKWCQHPSETVGCYCSGTTDTFPTSVRKYRPLRHSPSVLGQVWPFARVRVYAVTVCRAERRHNILQRFIWHIPVPQVSYRFWIPSPTPISCSLSPTHWHMRRVVCGLRLPLIVCSAVPAVWPSMRRRSPPTR